MSLIKRTLAPALRGLLVATDQITSDAPSSESLSEIIDRGHLRPNENDELAYWFARYLSIRDSLWEVIGESLLAVRKPVRELRTDEDWQYFLLGYSAACLLIRIDRLLLFDIAHHSLIQRKLNEAFPEYRIPRKQFTSVFSAYVNRRDALAIYDAIRHVQRNRAVIQRLCDDPDVGFLAQQLDTLEAYLDPSRRNYLAWLGNYFLHKWRRRGVVSLTNSLAKVLEGFGRTASEIHSLATKRVTLSVLNATSSILKPGDIIITRHDQALTNLFLPGFWPHALLYVGTDEQRRQLDIDIEQDKAQRWVGDNCVLEARKDGVKFRPLNDALDVDNFVVLRPELSIESTCLGIERAVRHEGKPYNFDFDFFNSDRLVCTEVVYRAFDGLEGVSFTLQNRANRKTLSAEDLLDYALSSSSLTPIAIFGVVGCEHKLVQGDAVRPLLIKSYEHVEFSA